MATGSGALANQFDPHGFRTFHFVSRSLDRHGNVELSYALDEMTFTESFALPVHGSDDFRGDKPPDQAHISALLALLHWVVGVSYYKTAVPDVVRTEPDLPAPATAALLEALYSEGLGEFAYRNALDSLPRPQFPARALRPSGASATATPRRLLVPIGGGKDSVVAVEIIRKSGLDFALFSIGDAVPIARTAEVAGDPWLVARRQLDDGLATLNRAGALNGHVPVTAIVSSAALLTAALNGFDGVAMANERSASTGNLQWDGVDVNHQFSKGLRVERLVRSALAEIAPGLEYFSVLRPASELAIARAFARLPAYHQAFTSCNTVFRLDPLLRGQSWCGDCPKCRFVFLALAPFSEPNHLAGVFGVDLLDDEAQFDGFALLAASGGHKPFECVGEEEESLAAIRLLAADPRWREHRVVRRLVAEVLPQYPRTAGDPEHVLTLSDDHHVPPPLLPAVNAVLGA
jgi:hypothetical protein